MIVFRLSFGQLAYRQIATEVVNQIPKPQVLNQPCSRLVLLPAGSCLEFLYKFRQRRDAIVLSLHNQTDPLKSFVERRADPRQPAARFIGWRAAVQLAGYQALNVALNQLRLLDRYRNFGSDGNRLTRNWAVDNGGDGFWLENGDNNTLTRNWALHNEGNGFALTDGSDNNTLEHNWALFNGGNGFALADGSDNNTLERNRAIHNAEWGFLVDEVLANMFDDNHCHANGLGGSNQPGVC